ncbi:unnamed protein product, partial [Meganyctiphanes norvegica]
MKKANCSPKKKIIIGVLGSAKAVLFGLFAHFCAREMLSPALYDTQTLYDTQNAFSSIHCMTLKVFRCVLERCSAEDGLVHLRQHVMYVMAHQLHKHTSVSTELLSAALSLATRHTFSFDHMEMEVDPSLALPHQVSLCNLLFWSNVIE